MKKQERWKLFALLPIDLTNERDGERENAQMNAIIRIEKWTYYNIYKFNRIWNDAAIYIWFDDKTEKLIQIMHLLKHKHSTAFLSVRDWYNRKYFSAIYLSEMNEKKNL